MLRSQPGRMNENFEAVFSLEIILIAFSTSNCVISGNIVDINNIKASLFDSECVLLKN